MDHCGPERPGAWRAALLALLLAAPWAATRAESAQDEPGTIIAPYEARYSIYRNGKLTGKMEVELEQHGERWVIRSSGSGTYGLARILGARDNEEVQGRIQNGLFRPRRYQRHTLVAGLDDSWNVGFDWDRREVHIRHNDQDPLHLNMAGDALDPLSLKLEMRQRLAEGNPDLDFLLVEEDEIDEQNFRVLPTERLETSLGCLLTHPVEKIHGSNKRYTRAWHAPALGFVEVRMEHGKIGGNHLEMRITELSFNDRDIPPQPSCADQRPEPGGS